MIRQCLKAIAVALIIFPEPVTTVLGVALLSAMMAVPGHKRLDDLGNMEELINRSLKNAKLSESGLHFPGQRTIVFHELKLGFALQPVTVPDKTGYLKDFKSGLWIKYQADDKQNSNFAVQSDHDLDNIPQIFQANYWFDNGKLSERVLHHTLKTSLPQYEALHKNTPLGDFNLNFAERAHCIKLQHALRLPQKLETRQVIPFDCPPISF